MQIIKRVFLHEIDYVFLNINTIYYGAITYYKCLIHILQKIRQGFSDNFVNEKISLSYNNSSNFREISANHCIISLIYVSMLMLE